VGDSLRVYRLQRKGSMLDLQRGLTQPYAPLWEAWLAYLTQQAMGQPTYVLVDLQDGEGFVQVRYRPHQAAADVAYIAPALTEGRQASQAWSRLLDGASVESAGRGIQRVFANLPESGAEVDVFQHAGFTLYAGEDVYHLAEPEADGRAETAAELRRQRPDDWPAVQKLCVAITPQRIRQMEGGIVPMTARDGSCERYVLPGNGSDEVKAAVITCAGGLGHWMRVLIHPEVRDVADGLIQRVLAEERPTKPVFCNVRQYESGVRPALEAAGFELMATRSLMVKHTVAWGKVPVPELASALKSSAEVVPPAYHVNGEPEFNTPEGRLAVRRDA
jgi:hypothetical protein